MVRFLKEQLSRRQFLRAAAGAAIVGLWGLRRRNVAATQRRGAIRVLVHDAMHDGGAFSQGQLLGARLDRPRTGGALRGAGAFESPLVTSPFPFTHVGLHWKGKGSDLAGAKFEVRTSENGRNWSPWRQAHIEATPFETPAGETYAALVGAPRHGYLQYRAWLPEATLISSVTATFINSVDGPVIESTASAGAAAVSGKPIDFTREGWGADESLRFRGKKEIWHRMYVPWKKLVVHHTATSNDYSDGAAEVRAIYTYHARTLGWGDIGYSVLVDRFGYSYEGRYGREDDEYGVDYNEGLPREIFGRDVVAGHALSHNYGSPGTAVIGNFEEAPPPSDGRMMARLVDLLEWEARLRQIDSHGVSDYLLSNDTWTRGLPNVCGHRDCNATLCPGQYVYDQLPSIRDELAARLAKSGAPGVALVSGPDGKTVPTGELSYEWSDPLGKAVAYSYYLEGWFKPSNSEDIKYLTGFTHDRLPAWSDWMDATSETFSGLADGHYTFHVRSRDADGNTSVYQANRTSLMTGTNGGGGGPGRGGGRGKKPPR